MNQNNGDTKMIDFSQDMQHVPNDAELKVISALAEEQLRLEVMEKDLQDQLKRCQESLTKVRESLLPDAMASVGLSEFRLASGLKLSIKDDVYASIRKDFMWEATDWLTDQGLGDIVKDKVEVSFGRGEAHLASQVLELCHKNGFAAVENLSVHPMTLKATVKEQLAKGVQFPEEFFSIHPVRKATIKLK